MAAGISEEAVEQKLLLWVARLGLATAHGPAISPSDARVWHRARRLAGWLVKAERW